MSKQPKGTNNASTADEIANDGPELSRRSAAARFSNIPIGTRPSRSDYVLVQCGIWACQRHQAIALRLRRLHLLRQDWFPCQLLRQDWFPCQEVQLCNLWPVVLLSILIFCARLSCAAVMTFGNANVFHKHVSPCRGWVCLGCAPQCP